MQAVIVHCLEPGRLARFWAEALGWRITRDHDPEWVVEPPEGSREGATKADVGQGDVPWTVMADPEGNEFCVLPAYSPEVRAQWRMQYEAYRRLD